MVTMKRVDDIMNKALVERAFPGAVIRVSEKGKVLFEKAFGFSDDGRKIPVSVSTVYDLASLTKPLSAVPAIMLLMQWGRLSFDSTMNDLLPGPDWGEKGAVTLIQLLTHSSGLPDYRPYFEDLKDVSPENRSKRLKELLVHEPLIDPPGAVTRYSDIGYMILAWVVEEKTGMPLSRFVESGIYAPLGIRDLFYMRSGEKKHRGRLIASTEQCPWRQRMLCGEVHDDNAWVMGGEGAHAGLFGTAEAIDRLLNVMLQNNTAQDSVFEPPVAHRFLVEWKNTRRTPGFDMPSAEGSSSGRYFSRSAVGHLGFTGTSFWVDRERDLIVIFLTNRVCPSRNNIRIRDIRPLVHDALMEEL